MHPLWKSFFSPRARFTRIGMAILLLAVIAWVTVDVIHDHELPKLSHVGEFLAVSGAAFYAVDKAAGHLNRKKIREP